ncbi:VCBS repeat-containing protein [Filobacillus milosensis]|uniref:VCBS repeat-containing protein n=1 Tax=Filobacillus milosensis TaxID=94137 RepID=A0A4Y8IEI4_9BACI|nr:VCBS repeat-containing protein [Filobacillus milosensis]TFB14646.1 VCBS repeat-containing protein [Filobacillus milosensis]
MNYSNRNIRQPEIVSFAQGDVTGDGVLDNVFLTGVITPDSPFTQKITLVVQDGVSGRLSRTELSENAGYNPTLFLGDMTGDGVDDILISIATGGSGGTMYEFIYSYLNDEAKLLFDSNVYNDRYNYEVTFQDYYKVEVVSEENNERYIIDISTRGFDYLNEIYDSNGRLIYPISGWVNPLSGLYPVDFNMDGVYELLIYQRIAGQYNADSLGYVLNTLQWNGENFELVNQYVAIFGTENT